MVRHCGTIPEPADAKDNPGAAAVPLQGPGSSASGGSQEEHGAGAGAILGPAQCAQGNTDTLGQSQNEPGTAAGAIMGPSQCAPGSTASATLGQSQNEPGTAAGAIMGPSQCALGSSASATLGQSQDEARTVASAILGSCAAARAAMTKTRRLAAQHSEASSVLSIVSSASERIPSGCLDKPSHIDKVKPPECVSHALSVAKELAVPVVAPAVQHNLRKQLELGKTRPHRRGKAKSMVMKKPAKGKGGHTLQHEKVEPAAEEVVGPYDGLIRLLPEEARPVGKRGMHSYTLKKEGRKGRIEVLSRPKLII